MLAKICPGCGDLVRGRCARGCVQGGKTMSDSRRRHLRVWQSPRWKALKRRVHVRDDWTCRDCGHRDPTGVTLVGDHVDGFVDVDDPRAFEEDLVETRCLTCSGAKDGGRPDRITMPL